MVTGRSCVLQVGALATGAWFLHHHFWALNVQLEGLQLRALCRLIFAAMVPATVLPGLILARSSQGLINAFLLTQASLQNSLACLQQHLPVPVSKAVSATHSKHSSQKQRTKPV